MTPIINVEATGKNIDKLMKERRLSKREIQEVCGFTTVQTIYKWVHGRCLPTVDNLLVLSYLFGVRIDDILVIENR